MDPYKSANRRLVPVESKAIGFTRSRLPRYRMQAKATPYDEVPYPSYTHPQTHPDRLAVLGLLFGLEPARVDRCRVLELGCGNGSNLVPMAWELPNSEFVGIDLAARPIAEGQRMLNDLRLTNVSLRHGDISEINNTWGKFDYIIAHGLFSWIPAQVRERLLDICHQCLSPQGIAFVSYNAMPGCHLRNMLREMLRFHVRDFRSPKEQVDQAIALTRFLTEAQDSRDEYRLWMKAELERILEHDEGHLFHDELAELNEPLYFTQFIEQAGRHELQYLGEADFFEMSDHVFKDTVRQTLKQLARNRILREQYLDFLKCRRFRQTLLCHRNAELQTEPQAEKVSGFFISSAATCISGIPNLRPGVHCTFETPKGSKIETDFALGKSALVRLGSIWPRPLPFDELLQKALADLKQAGVTDNSDGQPQERLRGFLLQLYHGGMVEFRTSLPPIVHTVSERPMASPVARWQVQKGQFVTSLFHIAIKVEDEIGRGLLSWLDGSLDHSALLEKIQNLLESKNALLPSPGDASAVRRKLEQELAQNLAKLARLGLLVG